MTGREVRKKLRNGERVYGTHIVEAGNPNYLLWMAESEMDFAFICTEHIPIDRNDVSWMCQFLANYDISPIVRIPFPDPYWATMNLDAGAQGIVAPYVETEEEVEKLIGAIRYRPIKGRKLAEMMSGRRPFGDKLRSYLDDFNGDKYLIIGIESVYAMENLDAMLSYDEVDGVFLGPHDLTCSMEIPEEYENPVFIDAMKGVIEACRSNGKGVGIHYDYELPYIRELLEHGINFVLNASDVMKAKSGLSKDFKEFRRIYGEASTTARGKDRAGTASNTGEIT